MGLSAQNNWLSSSHTWPGFCLLSFCCPCIRRVSAVEALTLELTTPLTEQGCARAVARLEADRLGVSFLPQAPQGHPSRPGLCAGVFRRNQTRRGLPLGSWRSSQRVESSIHIFKKLEAIQDNQEGLIPNDSEITWAERTDSAAQKLKSVSSALRCQAHTPGLSVTAVPLGTVSNLSVSLLVNRGGDSTFSGRLTEILLQGSGIVLGT